MASLSFKIKTYAASLGVSDIDWRTDVLLQNDLDERGEYINEWNLDIPQPTAEQLTAQETAATIAESNDNIDEIRKNKYLSWDKQLEMIYKDQKNGTTTFKDHCDKVKTDNPKS